MKKGCYGNEKIQFFSVDFKVPHDCLTLHNTIPTFNDPEKEGLENTVGKRENAGYQHFLLFPQLFLPLHRQISIFQSCLLLRQPAQIKDQASLIIFHLYGNHCINPFPNDKF